MTRRAPPGRWIAVALAAACIGAPTAPEAQAQAASAFTAPTEQRYDIPAQPLNAALAQFATVSGVDILYDHGLAAGRRSTAVAGAFSPQRAILLLLQGSGLTCRFTNRKAAVVFAETQPESGLATGGLTGAPPGPALALDVMRVTATPLIGSDRFNAYGHTAQHDIYDRLNADASMKGVVFDIEIEVRLGADGAIRALQLTRGSGDASLDRKIIAQLDGARLSQPPPAGLPQPMRFRIASR